MCKRAKVLDIINNRLAGVPSTVRHCAQKGLEHFISKKNTFKAKTKAPWINHFHTQ